MRLLSFWISMMMFHWTVGQIDSSAPGCAVRCWENTKYVSKCLDDNTCLCNDAEYQNSVFQCLYSQCDTAQFGFALHHAITECSGTGGEYLLAVPPIPKYDDLRRREAEYLAGAKLHGSGSDFGMPMDSTGFIAASVAPNNYPTQSNNNYPTQSVATPSSLTTSPPIPLETMMAGNPTSAPMSAMAASMMAVGPTSLPVSAIAGSKTPPPLYMGNASDGGPDLALPMLATLAAALYLAI